VALTTCLTTALTSQMAERATSDSDHVSKLDCNEWEQHEWEQLLTRSGLSDLFNDCFDLTKVKAKHFTRDSVP